MPPVSKPSQTDWGAPADFILTLPYLCVQQDTGESIAVKVIHTCGMSANELQNIGNEIRMIRDLRHRNIVQYLGMERTADELRIFLEFVPGGSLRQLLTERNGLPEPTTARFTYEILQGLHYLHTNEKTHRDIKVGEKGAGRNSHVARACLRTGGSSHKSVCSPQRQQLLFCFLSSRP